VKVKILKVDDNTGVNAAILERLEKVVQSLQENSVKMGELLAVHNEKLDKQDRIDAVLFEKIDGDYKIIKSTLDGSIQNQPKNIVLYVTSNRRHLMPRDMIENERSSAIHTDESVEEKISLSDRFGLWIGFHNISQNDFVNIILKYCEKFKLPFNEKTEKEAIKWSLQRGNRTGRSAWQFIINYAAENNKKIDF